MLDLQEWDIWEADVPYIDKPTKSSRRPVLVISPDKVLVLKITTHGHSDKPKGKGIAHELIEDSDERENMV